MRANTMGQEYPAKIKAALEAGARNQYAALCYRVDDGKTKVLLITSRGTGRWVIPKGWPIDGLTPGETGEREAWEEAGVKGKLNQKPVGFFSYDKVLDNGDLRPCVVMVFPLKVDSLAAKFPERSERRRKWFSPKKAAERVNEPELARILKEFDPAKLR